LHLVNIQDQHKQRSIFMKIDPSSYFLFQQYTAYSNTADQQIQPEDKSALAKEPEENLYDLDVTIHQQVNDGIIEAKPTDSGYYCQTNGCLTVGQCK